MRTDPPVRFAPGRQVLHRATAPRRMGGARPARVIADDSRGRVATRSPVATIGAMDARGARSMPFAGWITLEHRPELVTWSDAADFPFARPRTDLEPDPSWTAPPPAPPAGWDRPAVRR